MAGGRGHLVERRRLCGGGGRLGAGDSRGQRNGDDHGDDCSGSATVTVAQEVSAVVVSRAADTLVVDDTLWLVGEARDVNGHAVDGAELSGLPVTRLWQGWAQADLVTAAMAGDVFRHEQPRPGGFARCRR